MRNKLPKKTHEAIEKLSEEGNQLASAGRYTEAMGRYWAAFDLVPEPQTDWEATTWLISSIGDMLFQQREFTKARDAFQDAVRCPGGLGNPFIHLRLGQAYYELGDKAQAGDELTRAYMGGGRAAFAKEDPKYFQLLEKVLKPPVGHDRLP